MLSIKWILEKNTKGDYNNKQFIDINLYKHIFQPRYIKYNKSANSFQIEDKFNRSLSLYASILLKISNSDFMRVFAYEELLMGHNHEC